MISLVILEDDRTLLRVLQRQVEKSTAGFRLCACASTVPAAIDVLQDCKPDIVISDISLIGGTSFEVLTKAKYTPFAVIFISAHEDNRIKAAKFGAVDYLTKPYEEHELLAALDRACALVMTHRTAQSYNTLIAASSLVSSSTTPSPVHSVLPATSLSAATEEFLRTGINDTPRDIVLRSPVSAEYTTPANHIISVAADQDWSQVWCIGVGVPLRDKRRLAFWDKLLLPPARTDAHGKPLPHTLEDTVFMRVHRSWIVNLLHITDWKTHGKDCIATMSNGANVSVSRELKTTCLHRWRDAEQYKRLHHDAFLRKYGRK
jgi:DNA-binding LytR/AlgR family response regulator